MTAVASEVFSCFAAGDFARATALFTDDMTRSFGPEPGPRWRMLVPSSRRPMPMEEAEPTQIIAVSDVGGAE